MNVKINIKRPPIAREEIAANKNFGEVMRQYKSLTTPFYKTTWFYAGLSAAAAVVAALIIYIAPSGNMHRSSVASFLNPPVEKVNIPVSKYAMNADLGTTITYKTGSVIKIPANAFVDKKGNPVNGKVDLTYRELTEPIDMFLSGMPSNYETGGMKYTLESAGIIEIHASQKGKELNLNPEKEMNIALASHQPGKQYNWYKLDTQKKQWVNSGNEQPIDIADADKKDAANTAESTTEAQPNDAAMSGSNATASLNSKVEEARYELVKAQEMVKQMEATRPFEPKESKGHHRFPVAVSNLKEFAEFNIYKDVMFQADDENPDFDPKMYNIEWDQATLKPHKKGESYLLVLKNDDQTATYIVHPVFEGEAYNDAQNMYKHKLIEYEAVLADRRALIGEKEQELDATIEAIKKSGGDQQLAENSANPGNLTFHHFTVRSCGIWNLATPVLFPQGAMIHPHFTDESGKDLQFAAGKIYMVEKGRNALFSLADNGSFSYNPEKESMIWGVTADNKIAVFNYDNFKAMGKQSGSYTIKMQVSDADLADEAHIEYFLNI